LIAKEVSSVIEGCLAQNKIALYRCAQNVRVTASANPARRLTDGIVEGKGPVQAKIQALENKK